LGPGHRVLLDAKVIFNSDKGFYLGKVPDLTVVKDDGVASVPPGGTIPYLVTAVNQGDEAAYAVRLKETVPEGTTFNPVQSDPGWSCGGTGQGSLCELELSELGGGER
jgi:uncharacterized repeat protein (TIGR01451 family)